MEKLNTEQMGVADELLTTVIDTAPFAETRRTAIAVHRTQYSPLDRMPPGELGDEMAADYLAADHFTRVDPPVDSEMEGEIEHDLFEGLDL